MRTSLIASLGGICPFENPLTVTWGPFSPWEGPAIACSAADSASGSLGKASSSRPLKIKASPFRSESVLIPCYRR